jgi:adenylate cyclase
VALNQDQYQVLLIGLGFMSMAGFFAVHALSTPGVTLANRALEAVASPYSYATSSTANHAAHFDYGGTVVGLSAFLSIFAPSFLFAAAYTPAVFALRRLRIRASWLALTVAGVVSVYAALALGGVPGITELPISSAPGSWIIATVAVVLLGFAAAHQARTYLRTAFPMHGALALAYLLLAEAQVLMVTTEFWTTAWWGYHLLMLTAVILAIGALFVELDRRRGLERFLPNEVVERVVAGDGLKLGGERRVVTVLFADLRNSTSIAESLPADQVVTLLNAYVGSMAECVFEHGGMLDKFLGDGVMAVFGIADDGSEGAVAATRTAQSIRQAVERVNQKRSGSAVGCGVGIHTGEVVLGAVGIPQRSDFTAIGDTVNTASRLEGTTKQYGVTTVLSEETARRLGGAFTLRELGSTPIRGRQEPVLLYTIDP